MFLVLQHWQHFANCHYTIVLFCILDFLLLWSPHIISFWLRTFHLWKKNLLVSVSATSHLHFYHAIKIFLCTTRGFSYDAMVQGSHTLSCHFESRASFLQGISVHRFTGILTRLAYMPPFFQILLAIRRRGAQLWMWRTDEDDHVLIVIFIV